MPPPPVAMVTTDAGTRPTVLSVQMSAPAGLMGFAHGNTGHGVEEDPISDGESVASSIKPKCVVKSGMVVKATDNIKSQEVWPHYNLNYAFITQPIEFHQITFEQYIAGEGKTVLNSVDPNEIRGRLNLLIRISYLKQKGYSWPNLRALYAAIMNHIEKHESSWVSDWRSIEDMVLDSTMCRSCCKKSQ